jgi:signal transduction histidine kinase
MNQHLQNIVTLIQQDENLSEEQKAVISKSLKDADKELEIVSFKLDRTEKVKRTTAILLEETIEELEQKRKAVEAQNRELEIESSLERVRTIAMSMNKPEDMVNVCNVISDQLQLLSVKDIRNVQTAIINDQKGTYLNYQYFTAYKEGVVEETDYNKHPKVLAMVEEMKKSANSSFNGNMENLELDKFREWRNQNNQFPDPLLDESRSMHYYFLSIGQGGLGLTTYKPLQEEGLGIFKRFHNVFTLAYRRFTDIELAIEQAREAQIEASLERIRAAAMAMRDTAELGGIIYKLYGELTKLDARLDRCFIMIVNPKSTGITWWLAGKEGLLAENGFFVPMNQHPTHLMYLDSWMKRKKKWQYLFEGKEKKDWDRFGFSKTELARLPEFIKKDMAGVRKINLSGSSDQFGSLVTGSLEPLPEEQQDIISRFTIAFNQAYIRFLDLQKAEAQARQAEQDLIEIKAARKKAEETLTELQATQAQLIQAEKMASLGELTAGIAHEIQNPLNFVNNFSEVSSELISEMVEEVDKGNYEEVKAIAGDVKQNLDKINHHGKRAGDIVKGMLQHSRTSTGQKEPTDINALADEYLRLAYHGLRAKDKSFNADFKSELDPDLPIMMVVPQDIGRVLLNLINNAFYAVDEKKKKQQPEGYKPIVTVSTKIVTKVWGKGLEISVKDNGNGIPQKILDKIFQPFFTTKPTGQGTGLGLSLSYDIVKAHGGELKVETKEGEGSEFIIHLVA